jgi:hypothetical protein
MPRSNGKWHAVHERTTSAEIALRGWRTRRRPPADANAGRVDRRRLHSADGGLAAGRRRTPTRDGSTDRQPPTDANAGRVDRQPPTDANAGRVDRDGSSAISSERDALQRACKERRLRLAGGAAPNAYAIAMDMFDRLAEARIRDWQERGRPLASPGATSLGEAGNLETQLLAEIVALRAEARTVGDAAQQSALRKRARELKLQLMVLLESSGRPLAARQIERNLQAAEAPAGTGDPDLPGNARST